MELKCSREYKMFWRFSRYKYENQRKMIRIRMYTFNNMKLYTANALLIILRDVLWINLKDKTYETIFKYILMIEKMV